MKNIKEKFKKYKEQIIKTLEVLVMVFISIFCVISLYQKVFNNSPILGYRIFVIVSNSMKPRLSKNDVILVKEEKYDKIKIGDMLTYNGLEDDVKDKIITHEVVNIATENGKHIFYTKGTTNFAIDPAVYEEQIYGVVQYKFVIISFLSKILRSTVGFICLIVLPLIYLFITEILDVKKEIKSN